MQIEQLPGEMRSCLRGILPDKAFIRRDRGEALFISNAPVFSPEIADIPGFLAEKQGNLVHLLPDGGWIARLEDACSEAPDFFSRTLMRFRSQDPDRENLILFAQGIKILDGLSSASGEDIAAFDRALRQRVAAALRGECGGGLYAASLLNCEIHTLYKGEKHT